MAFREFRAYSRAMKALRPLLNCVLGLALLVQGFAFASAPQTAVAKVPAAVEQAGAGDEMPCHGDSQKAEPEDSAPCACCDGGCVDMSGCAFGHLFAAVPALPAAVVPASQGAIAAPDRSAESVSLPSRLRPPISLRA